ncbi:hypothetical protein FTUN_7315 [Frigoriglobus tundricola]|uniref:Uncharacterized protein n=1 Tax=Frigoriglobus tundricola TaxID=2774151 RepID=A0A6M5Z1K4_9BACT|nr:hypothetical protein FTUN_7315 [Frigoriglobus tundricola]
MSFAPGSCCKLARIFVTNNPNTKRIETFRFEADFFADLGTAHQQD